MIQQNVPKIICRHLPTLKDRWWPEKRGGDNFCSKRSNCITNWPRILCCYLDTKCTSFVKLHSHPSSSPHQILYQSLRKAIELCFVSKNPAIHLGTLKRNLSQNIAINHDTPIYLIVTDTLFFSILCFKINSDNKYSCLIFIKLENIYFYYLLILTW